MNKKGSALDVVFISIALFVFSIVMLIILTFVNSFVGGIADIPAVNQHAIVVNEANDLNNNLIGTIDNASLMILILMFIVSLILAALVLVHPIFMILYIVVWLVGTILAATMSNAYQTAAATSGLAGTAAKLTITGFIMTYLPIIIFVMGGIMLFVLYKVRANITQ